MTGILRTVGGDRTGRLGGAGRPVRPDSRGQPARAPVDRRPLGGGPVYFPAGRYLLWSDIPNDRILRWDETTGVGVFRHAGGLRERAHARPRRAAWSAASTATAGSPGPSTTARSPCWPAYDGKRLNSPNDVVVKRDGSVWFTDPAYGIDSDYEGHRRASEIGGCHVYRSPGRGA